MTRMPNISETLKNQINDPYEYQPSPLASRSGEVPPACHCHRGKMEILERDFRVHIKVHEQKARRPPVIGRPRLAMDPQELAVTMLSRQSTNSGGFTPWIDSFRGYSPV